MEERITIDTDMEEIERKVNGLGDVFGKVGGMQHLLVLVFSFFFKPYTLLTFRAEAINTFFTISSNDKSLIKGKDKLKLTFFNKVRIILNLCPNPRLVRIL
jgi:hypothetical protein